LILDGRQIAPHQLLEAEVVIVGAGAAGITLARGLARRGRDVLLLESGGFEYHQATQDLYRGAAAGEALEPGNEYLASSRLRYVGGSSNHWAGFCRPLDSTDFERLPWIEGSGWPIAERELSARYAEAAEVLGIPPFSEGPEERDAGGFALPADGPLTTPVFHFSRVQHRRAYGAEIEASERIRLVTWANLTEIRLAADGASVDRLNLAVLEGPRFAARGRCVVLAAGGIENARLLLASRSVHARGIGNAHDRVGRCFMDHPHRRLGSLLLTRPPEDLRLWEYWMGPSKRLMLMLHPSLELRRERAIGNVLVRIVPEEKGTDPAVAAIGTVAAAMDRPRAASGVAESLTAGFLYAQAEQVPNPASRVRLDEESDALGVPRARLEWRLLPQDLATLLEASRIVARELGRAALGRAEILAPDSGWDGVIGGNHHMGTTRMAANGLEGVVDGDGRVFGVGNLFVAGSSVFPTSGAANPTFTITALALRLAECLDRELGSA